MLTGWDVLSAWADCIHNAIGIMRCIIHSHFDCKLVGQERTTFLCENISVKSIILA